MDRLLNDRQDDFCRRCWWCVIGVSISETVMDMLLNNRQDDFCRRCWWCVIGVSISETAMDMLLNDRQDDFCRRNCRDAVRWTFDTIFNPFKQQDKGILILSFS